MKTREAKARELARRTLKRLSRDLTKRALDALAAGAQPRPDVDALLAERRGDWVRRSAVLKGTSR